MKHVKIMAELIADLLGKFFKPGEALMILSQAKESIKKDGLKSRAD